MQPTDFVVIVILMAGGFIMLEWTAKSIMNFWFTAKFRYHKKVLEDIGQQKDEHR